MSILIIPPRCLAPLRMYLQLPQPLHTLQNLHIGEPEIRTILYLQDYFLDLEKARAGDVWEVAVRKFHGVLREREIDRARGGEACEVGRIDSEGFVAGFTVYERDRVFVTQDLAVRGSPRLMSSLLHEIVIVRGMGRSKDQILRRISMGWEGKR
jgi:hypothetical protein